MSEFFPQISPICYEGPQTKNSLAYRYYDANKKILGKTMAEHLRASVCFWHTFCWAGHDIFGDATFDRPWLTENDPLKRAEHRVDAAFEFISKLGLPFFAFHDRDIAPEGFTLAESNKNLQHIAQKIADAMQKTGIQLLWGTANLFSHRRYMAGAATNPDPEVFAYAVAQVKQAFDITRELNGANYVLWGGREGYDTLLNTDLRREADQMARFLSLLVDYKHKVGFKGTLLIEPKPCEPTKHQYDYDTATVFAFLQKYDLANEFKVNIEANHATLSGHSFPHEVAYACANGLFGSIDANRGDSQLGWDTDQFPLDLSETAQVWYYILQQGGFTTGGFNFDTKLRRQSIDLEDMFYGHISGVDTLARGLLIAEKMLAEKNLADFVKQRYGKWDKELGKKLFQKESDMTSITDYVFANNLDPQPISGRQEWLENLVNHQI